MRNLVLGAFFILALATHAQPFQWTTYSSTSNVMETLQDVSQIWAATTGGVFDFDIESGLFDVYTNTNGLAMNQCTAIGKDRQGWLWIGFADGRITRLYPGTGEVKQIVDLQNEVFEIHAIVGIEDEVFVAANNGIYRFSYRDVVDNYRVLESIHVIGAFPGETRVNAIATLQGYVYAATPVGLARASLAQESLSPPSAWETFTTANSELPENNVLSVFAPFEQLWISTANFVLYHDGENFGGETALGGVTSWGYQGAGVLASNAAQAYELVAITWQPLGNSIDGISGVGKIVVRGEAVPYVARGDLSSNRGGLSFLENGTWTEPVRSGGLGGNVITALATGPDGRIWAGTSTNSGTPGTFVYDGLWQAVLRRDGAPLFRFETTGFAFDGQGGTWASSFGDGIAWVRNDSTFNINHSNPETFSSAGPRFSGIPEDQNFVVARVASNARGDIYAVDRRAADFRPLLRISAEWIAQGNHPEPWDYYTFGQTETGRHIQELFVDQQNRVWVGPDGETGFTTSWVYDDAGTPTNINDDEIFSFVPSERQDDAFTCFDDIHPQALDWEVDHQGYLWVATPTGAYYTQGGIPSDLRSLFFICVADLPTGNRVNDIHVDSQDNKWFATDEGVAVLDANFNWVHVFREITDTDFPSDLCANNVTSITSDPATGDIWIGTTDGLSRLKSPYVSRGNDLDELWAYPNPYKADGSQRMFVDHQRLGGAFDELRIYTISGRLVRKLSWSEMIDPTRGWNGRNDDGDLVAAGIYLIVAAAENGTATTGKVAVLGR